MSELVPIVNKVEYAQTLAHSNLLPKHFQNNPANLLYAIEFAEALGMKPIHAITSVHVINGKPSASADLIGTMVRRAGHRLRVTGDDTFAEAVLVRSDDPDFEFRARWDMDKARKAGLNTPTWKAYPGAMLRSRAITEVCRSGAPDALHGIQHSTEELQSLGEVSRPAVVTVTERLKAASEPEVVLVEEEPTISDKVRADTAAAIAADNVADYLDYLAANNAPQHITDYVKEQTK